VSWLLTKLKAQRQRARELVKPIIAKRLHDLAEQNQKWDRPNDLIAWLIEACPPELRTVPLLTNRLLVVNFVAIHASSMVRRTFWNVIYRLADNPQWAEPMREEVERVVATEGWSKLALAKMRRVDSFIRETQRIQSISLLSLQRWSMKPFTFSNAHHGERAAAFNPWRWADIRQDDAESLKHQMVATGSTLLHFGHGKHACPGRFFAANELKGMLAHLVLEYVRFKEGENRPASLEFGSNIVPTPAQLEFRKRQGKA
ncbi:cytochrome P450, partial [Peniophora sp. CONT]